MMGKFVSIALILQALRIHECRGGDLHGFGEAGGGAEMVLNDPCDLVEGEAGGWTLATNHHQAYRSGGVFNPYSAYGRWSRRRHPT
jgi:hypothetical protein